MVKTVKVDAADLERLLTCPHPLPPCRACAPDPDQTRLRLWKVLNERTKT